jgi:hypothetical protein
MALAKLPNYTTRRIWEATEISLHENFSEEGGYQFSPAWKIIIHTGKQQRGCHKPSGKSRNGHNCIKGIHP